MKIRNKKTILWLIGIFVFLIVIFNYSNFFGGEKQVAGNEGVAQTVVAETGDIKNSIDVVGNAELVDEQSLSFNKTGTITAVYFDEGDSVVKGDIIAQLDDSDGYDEIEKAKLSLQNANISLQQLYDDVDDSQKLQAENAIKKTEDSIATAKEELENFKVSEQNSLEASLKNIETLEKELETSKNNLEIAKSDLEVLKKQKDNDLSDTISNTDKTVKNLESSLVSEEVTLDQIVEDVDYILGYTTENETKNDDFEQQLGSKAPELINKAESSFSASLKLYDNVKSEIDAYESGDTDNLKTILSDIIDLYEELDNTTELTYEVLDNSSVNSSFTQSELDSKKNTMVSDRTSIQSKITSLTSSINTLETLTDVDLLSESNQNSILSQEESIKQSEISIEKQEREIEEAKKAYEVDKKDYEIQLASKQKDLESSEQTLEINKASLEELLEGPTEENVQKAKNSVTQAQLTLKAAQEDLDDYQLEAPFDGVIRKIDYMVGDKINNDTDKYIYIENPNLLEISVMLDQIDIVTVEKGDTAIVTFDAYPTIPVNAKISNIDTTPVSSSGVISYEVKIVLDDETFDKKVLSGMTADVEILTESKEGVILVKTTAITEENGESFVNILKDGKVTKTKVETGIEADGKTEIVSGVAQGDVIVLPMVDSGSSSDSEVRMPGVFGGGGGGGGMGGPPM